jgi:hypothetical protein
LFVHCRSSMYIIISISTTTLFSICIVRQEHRCIVEACQIHNPVSNIRVA